MTNGPMASLQFLGAAGGVTGSKFLFSYRDDQLLIDCGLFQGLKELRQRNWAQVPIDLHRLRAVILTHAHIDHPVICLASFRRATGGRFSQRRGPAISCT